MNTLQVRRPSRQRGFTLIEALIALLVMAFGMLALSGMQMSLSRNADVAKQRTEAMRLAQARIEDMRSFTGISTGTINWNALDATANTTATTNTTYTVASTMGGVDTDAMRAVNVLVTWTDRTGAAQSVNIASVISQTDPRDPGFIGNPLPLNSPLKRPKNRDINIPIPAVSLGNTGKSSYQLAPGVTIIFSDLSGAVVEKCTGTVDAATYVAGTAGCSTLDAYIVAGYVSGAITTSGTTPFSPTLPTGINTNGVTGWDNSGGKTISCVYTRAIDQNNLSTAIAGYHYYLCIIPVTPGGTWGGTIRLGGLPTNSNYKVCRFQYAANSNLTVNMQNIQAYVGVNQSLDEQNYYIENSNNANCPTIGGLALTLHQNCRSSAAPTTTAAGTCPLTTHNTGP